MKASTDALELLRDQHDEVLDLIERIEDSDDPDAKAPMFRELADKIAAHSAIEEKLFYPSVMSERTNELLIESTEEHLAVKRVLSDLLELDPDDDHWMAKLRVLRDELEHHARDEEEGKLFPIVRKELDADQLAGLGNDLLAMFEELIEREPRMQVPNETAAAVHLEAPVAM
jgi:hemerythrin superfamily protein